MPQPTKPNKIRYIAIELLTPRESVVADLWAARVDDNTITFHAQFDPSDRASCEECISHLIQWSMSDVNLDELEVEFVVWQKDKLLLTLAEHQLGPLFYDWLDFISFYAGMQGLSYSSARGELMNAEMGIEGVRRAQLLAQLFATLLRMSEHRKILFEAAQEVTKITGDVKNRSALVEEIFRDPPESETAG